MNDDSEEPASRRSSWLDRLLQSLSGSEPQDRDGLRAVLRAAQDRALLDNDALAMMEGVLAVAEMRVRDVMIPRAQMVYVERDWPLDKILATVIASGHSRLPVVDDDRDDVIGVLIVKDLLRYFAEADNGRPRRLDLGDLLRPAKVIPESKRLNALLKEFRNTRLHMAIVVDEYGGVAGLVTIEDLLEQIVGEIDDEHDDDSGEDQIRQTGDRIFIIDGLTPVEEFNAYFGSRFSDERADTVGGLVSTELGRLPKHGEKLHLDGCQFRVLRSDGRRVRLLELVLPSPEQNADADAVRVSGVARHGDDAASINAADNAPLR